MKRRKFIKISTVASACAIAPFNILKAGPSPNEKLNIAVIGVGGQGAGNAQALSKTDNIVAFCDVHESWHKRAISRYKDLQNVKLWKDYRVMFDKIGKDIDAVCIATPEHAHFAISMYAMRHGKHVYCQKPLCHNLEEIRLLTEESKKHKVITQMGNQGHSSHSEANIRDWIQSGAIGDVKKVICYSEKNYWTDKPPVTGSKIPDDLDWNLFLNRAGDIPFSDSYMDRNWIDFSHFSGTVGDMGGHILDPAFYSLELGAPISVRADVEVPAKPWSMPPGSVITWKFPARGSMPPVEMQLYLGNTWKNGPRPERLEEGANEGFMNSGSVMIGEKASIIAGSHGQNGRIIPDFKAKEIGDPSGKSLRVINGSHFENFSRACKGQEQIMSPFVYSGPHSEIISLGDIALKNPNKTLEWDAINMKFTNDEGANKCLFLRRSNNRDSMNWY